MKMEQWQLLGDKEEERKIFTIQKVQIAFKVNPIVHNISIMASRTQEHKRKKYN